MRAQTGTDDDIAGRRSFSKAQTDLVAGDIATGERKVDIHFARFSVCLLDYSAHENRELLTKRW